MTSIRRNQPLGASVRLRSGMSPPAIATDWQSCRVSGSGEQDDGGRVSAAGGAMH